MTKNNLSEHLSWLCISKPSKPPPGSSVPVITDPSTAGSLDDQDSGFVPTQEGLLDPEIDALETKHNPSSHPREDHLETGPRVHISETSNTSYEVQSMARLQCGPKSATKKQLLSQKAPSQLPSPVATETGSSRRPIRDVYNAQFRTQPSSEPPHILLDHIRCSITDVDYSSYSIPTKQNPTSFRASETGTLTLWYPTPHSRQIDEQYFCLESGCCRSYRRV